MVDRRARADPAARSQVDVAGDAGPRRDVHEVLDDHVVPDRGIEVEDREVADRDAAGEPDAGAHDHAGASLDDFALALTEAC